jgi:rhodanese-related sulfurtransferase
MATPIDRRQVQELVGKGAQLVEVLPAEEYAEDHLPGAVSIPLRNIDEQGVAGLDRGRPVIVYCWDSA